MARYTFNYKSWETIDGIETYQDSEYNITDEYGDVIYSALVPAGHKLENLNDIFSKYINPWNPFDYYRFEDQGQAYHDFDFDCKKKFIVKNLTEGVEDEYIILYDWSYDTWNYEEITLDTSIVSNSPLPTLDYRMYFLLTVKPTPVALNSIEMYWDNTGEPFYIRDFADSERQLDLNFNIMMDFANASWGIKSGQFNMAFDEQAFFVGKATEVPKFTYTIATNWGQKFNVANTCKSHCLYYRNERGGWNFLLIDGIETMNEEYTVNSYKKNTLRLANVQAMWPYEHNDRQYVNYSKGIKTKWILNTGYMNDNQSSKMSSLFRSNLIYMQDLNTRKVVPVNITDMQYTYKTFKNQKGKFAQYTINVQEANDKKIVF